MAAAANAQEFGSPVNPESFFYLQSGQRSDQHRLPRLLSAMRRDMLGPTGQTEAPWGASH